MMARSSQWRSTARKHGRDLDHPGDRPPEEVGETLERAYVVLKERILAVLGEPPRRFRFSQARRVGFARVRRSALLP